MALKKLKPVTPGTRHRLSPGFDDITASTPEKSLVITLKKTGGRNSNGRMTMRYIGGGHKQSCASSISNATRQEYPLL
jgi:large subunit ribosomal protein L2